MISRLGVNDDDCLSDDSDATINYDVASAMQDVYDNDDTAPAPSLDNDDDDDVMLS